jgi:hypothetical protein
LKNLAILTGFFFSGINSAPLPVFVLREIEASSQIGAPNRPIKTISEYFEMLAPFSLENWGVFLAVLGTSQHAALFLPFIYSADQRIDAKELLSFEKTSIAGLFPIEE